MRSLDALRDEVCRRDPDEPTMAEIDGMRRELAKMFPDGMTLYSRKPEEPVEGDMYAEDDGRVMIYTDGVWKQVVVEPPPSGPYTAGGPVGWGPPGPIGGIGGGSRPDAREQADRDRTAADADNTELLEILLCPECDMELSANACSPRHAYLADNPLEHRLLKPLLERYLRTH